MARFLWLIGVAALMIGCGDECSSAEEASLNFGSGDRHTGFLAFEDDEGVVLEIGYQGLPMFDNLAIFAEGVGTEQEGPRSGGASLEVFHDGAPVGSAPDRWYVIPESQDGVSLVGVRIITDVPAVELWERDVTFEATVTGSCGVSVSKSQVFAATRP